MGRAVPYGIYDVLNNRGTVYVGKSADTPAFAVDAIAGWWEQSGRATFPTAKQLLILSDGGGSKGYRPRLWKERLQAVLCDRLGLQVTVPLSDRLFPMEPRRASSVQLHQRQLRGNTGAHLGVLPGRHCGTTTKAGLTV